MKRRAIISALVALIAGLAATVAYAKVTISEAPELAAALTDSVISVTSEFKGARVTVFGAARAAPDTDLVVAVRGPKRGAAIFKQERVALFWLPRKPVRFDDSPGYFAAASTRPLADIASQGDLQHYGLDPAGSARISQSHAAHKDLAAYRLALARLMAEEGLYIVNPTGLQRLPGGLFRADVEIPASAPVGDYVAETYLFRDGKLLSRRASALHVDRAGIERFIYSVAHKRPVSYALACLALALGAGWAAAMIIGRR